MSDERSPAVPGPPPAEPPAASAGGEVPTALETEMAGAPEGDPAPEALAAAFEAELAEAWRQAEESRREAEANWDRYLRAEAELDNLRKRGERQRQEAVDRGRRALLLGFLELADNLERALTHARADPAALLAGIEGTYRQVEQLLERAGVARIEAADQAFDPHLHEAVGVLAVPGLAEEKVISVEQAGYSLDGSLLRPARVIVGQPAGDGGAAGEAAG